jgi:uncharacterized oligopeptide transporter (OPT) family protein
MAEALNYGKLAAQIVITIIIVLLCFFLSPFIAPIAGFVLSGFSGRSGVSGQRVTAKQIADGLDNSSRIAEKVADGERATEKGLADQAGFIKSATDAVDDGLEVLRDIQDANASK